jgi:opacity protein-like surface antigen
MRRILPWLVSSLALCLFPAWLHAGFVSGVDAMTATVLQEHQSSFSGIGVRLRLRPASLIQAIEIMPTIEYWRNSTTVQPYDIQASRKDATLGLDARYNFSSTGWKPYAGAGIGIHFLSNKVTAPSFGLNEASDSVIKGGLAVLGGVSFALSGKLENFVDLKYHHITDYRQLKINWGLAYNL